LLVTADPPLLSIEPTINVLKEINISGVNFAKIIEAIVIHSYRIYEGKNEVAQILQDSDKLAGLGFRGFLDIIKYFGGKDFVDSKEIIENNGDESKFRELDNYSLEQIEEGPVLDGVIKGLDMKIGYENLFHTKSALLLARERLDYFKKIKKILVEKFNL